MSDVKTHAELVRSGFDPGEIRRMRRSGLLVPVRRGAYVPPGDELDRYGTHRRLIEATLAQSRSDGIVSHVSSAVLQDKPVPYADLSLVHLTRDREGGGRARRWTRVHGTPLDPADVVEIDGVGVTSLPRTFVDVARTLGPMTSVALGDAMLRSGITRADLEAAVQGGTGRHGIAAARRVLALLDPRAESPGESVSRVVMSELGLPAPVPQLVLTQQDGAFVARVDFGWPDLGVVGEFDGRAKYGRMLRNGEDPADVLWSEKLREDQIRRLGWIVVRWTWDDLIDPAGLARRFRQAFLDGRSRPVPVGARTSDRT